MSDQTNLELGAAFDSKMPTLTKELEKWFAEECAAIDGSVESAAPSGTGGSIITARPAIDSKRVLDATIVTEEVLGIHLPPEIIKPGGYDSCDEMISDIVAKLRKVYVGELKVKKKQPAKQPETV